MSPTLAESTTERKFFVIARFWSEPGTDPTPGGRRLRPGRIAGRQQHLQFMGFQALANPTGALRPETEAPSRQAFLAQPEPLRVIHQDLEAGGSPVAEHKETAGKGSAASTSWQTRARPSIPRRRSIAATATRTRI